jgi:DNA mismatch endonuclease (patch repair protein)
MQACRSRDTTPEVAVRRRLHALGLRYRVAYRPLPGLRRSGDIVFPRRRIVVFIDGCFWHGCPEHATYPRANADYWGPKLARNRTRDAETDGQLRAAGWRVIRVWEHEPLDEAVSRILAEIKALSHSAGEPSAAARLAVADERDAHRQRQS